MSSSANEQSTEVGGVTEQETSLGISKSPIRSEVEEGEEEDEEEDIDFNPFLRGTPSPEASSSLSSEVVGDSELGEEEITAQAKVCPDGACEEENKCLKDVARKTKKRKSVLISQPEPETVLEKENGSISSGIDVNDCMVEDLSNTTHSQKPLLDLEDEDAICRRTRAQYSLASFTLDELEAFLQETDDDDDLQNVDDEEEYRKFLAAVLQGGDVGGQSTQEIENFDDEDEDNDADFEIELEEMLESDYDEGTADKTQKEEFVRARRRPETRQNKRQKASSQYKDKLLEQSKRPLRPRLPILPNKPPIVSFPIFDGKSLMPETAPSGRPSTPQAAFINGFSPHQIGQLYCLIHEHVQLLIQVFSVCILDTSRQNIASQVQGLIFEMLHKRDETIAVRNESYPDIYFRPPYICSSVPDALPQFDSGQRTCELSCSLDLPGVCSPNIEMSVFENVSNFEGSQVGSVQSVNGSLWLPSISGSVQSVLDVAPLSLVGKYLGDVCTAVQEYRHRCLAFGSDTCFGREPLFPFPPSASSVEANGEVSRGRILSAAKTVTSSPSLQAPKRSLAAALVESTKKQSVALVHKEISKLAQRFFPLFNPSLFPHKPPPVSVANRVLFTDAEDELLALGMMEYNTDWKAIQQRFLPCKSKHQIFVRQKNRCSSKAPENPIKAVRRMKTSPLTAKEIECIQEGLKVFKLDWVSVWKFVVPRRDPSLLHRQWRIALGTQKCYKQDTTKKEKRRLYEFKRRCRTADLANWHLDSDKEVENAGENIISNDGYLENTEEGYVHEGFLADWRPAFYDQDSSGNPCINLGEKLLSCGTVSREGNRFGEEQNNFRSVGALPRTTNMHEYPYRLNYSQNPYPSSHLTHVRHNLSNTMQPNHPVPNMASKTSKFQVCLPPYRARRRNNAHLVKLASDLPPVNLPPSARVIPQSAFKSVQCGSSGMFSATAGAAGHSEQENTVPLIPHPATPGSPCLITAGGRDERNPMKENVTNSHLEEFHVVEEERGTESDLQMHPLLFQAPEDGHLPHYPLNSSTSTSSSFSFFSGNQPQLNLSLFRSPRQHSHVVNCFNKSLKTNESTSGSHVIDFHPLLKRTEIANSDLVMTPSNARLSVGLERKLDQHRNPFDAGHNRSSVNKCPFAARSAPANTNEKANELDLEIHLSSSSGKERSLGNRDMTRHNSMRSTTFGDSGDKTEIPNNNSICYQYGENCSQDVSNGHFSTSTTRSIDNIGDHSHPDIVMEQEELSDSDEEIEEHVEFECEEMTDSEGDEGSDCGQIAETKDKEVGGLLTGKVTDGDSDDQHVLRSPHGHGDASAPRIGSSPFLKLGRDTTSSSWLSLNSSALGHPTCTKSKNTGVSISEGPATKNTASRPIRSCKKKTTRSTKKVAVQTHATDMAQQLSLSSLAVQTVRKPRRRGSQTNTGLNIRTTDDKY